MTDAYGGAPATEKPWQPKGKTPEERAQIKVWLEGRMLSGFCNEFAKSGQHEGHRPQSASGRPMITCPMTDTCSCKCHYEVDQLFLATGMERKPMSNPEYVPEIITFDYDVSAVDPLTGVASIATHTDTPDVSEEPVVAPAAPATTPLAQRRTPMGYAGRGTLEAQVWDAVTIISGLGVHPITTLLVSEWIREKYKVPTPSRGAIQAVWVRWDKMNFASWEKNPVHFTGFLATGSWDELERIKAKAKQARKHDQAAAKRGAIRPRSK